MAFQIVANGNTFEVGDYCETDMNWKKLYFGHVTVSDMRKYTPEPDWQKVRLDMKGKTLAYKYSALCKWLIVSRFSYGAKIQVTNYVTALSRGGLIKPDDYR